MLIRGVVSGLVLQRHRVSQTALYLVGGARSQQGRHSHEKPERNDDPCSGQSPTSVFVYFVPRFYREPEAPRQRLPEAFNGFHPQILHKMEGWLPTWRVVWHIPTALVSGITE